MELKTVISSRIAKVGYSAGDHELVLEFKKGRKYKYYPVPIVMYELLMSAESLGKFFELNIKNNKTISHEKLDD